jgi:glycosyltransferase involved in cell wall biosynthesis
MSSPLVSICVPNLNTRSFLEERFDSIFRQTFQDWELFVYDSYSDDGSWEFICEIAKRDKRLRIAQGPREGVYPAWNECLRHTRGDLVYIATSDDSMALDLMEKMVAALEQHPQCELAHCPLKIVDEHGETFAGLSWPESTVFADGVTDFIGKPHVRHAPYDGLTQITGRQVVLAVNQLLIRRSIFSRIGDFSNRWGSVGDFHWEMKAGLVANTIFVPNTWASWRSRPAQATASVDFFSEKHHEKIEEMIRDAVAACENQLPAVVSHQVITSLLDRARDLRTYYSELRERDSVMRRRLFQAGQLCIGPASVRDEILGRFLGRPKWPDNAAEEIRLWLQSLGLQPVVASSLEMTA